jgi:hypothetical protein
VCQQLGLIWEQRILISYAELFETIKENLSLRFMDLTFANFDGIKIEAKHFGITPADTNQI